jgi:hypothetical protein
VLLLAAKLLPTGLGLPLLFITGFAGIAFCRATGRCSW